MPIALLDERDKAELQEQIDAAITATDALQSDLEDGGIVVASAKVASEADKATKDGNGKNIASTYATKDVASTTTNGLMSATDKKNLNKVIGNTDLGNMTNKTIPQLKTIFEDWLKSNYMTPNATAVFNASANWLDLWNTYNTTGKIKSGGVWTITVVAKGTSSKFTQLRVAKYGTKSVYYITRTEANGWEKVRRVAFMGDIDTFLTRGEFESLIHNSGLYTKRSFVNSSDVLEINTVVGTPITITLPSSYAWNDNYIVIRDGGTGETILPFDKHQSMTFISTMEQYEIEIYDITENEYVTGYTTVYCESVKDVATKTDVNNAIANAITTALNTSV